MLDIEFLRSLGLKEELRRPDPEPQAVESRTELCHQFCPRPGLVVSPPNCSASMRPSWKNCSRRNTPRKTPICIVCPTAAKRPQFTLIRPWENTTWSIPPTSLSAWLPWPGTQILKECWPINPDTGNGILWTQTPARKHQILCCGLMPLTGGQSTIERVQQAIRSRLWMGRRRSSNGTRKPTPVGCTSSIIWSWRKPTKQQITSCHGLESTGILPLTVTWVSEAGWQARLYSDKALGKYDLEWPAKEFIHLVPLAHDPDLDGMLAYKFRQGHWHSVDPNPSQEVEDLLLGLDDDDRKMAITQLKRR